MHQRKSSLSQGSNRKMRSQSKTKDATPIKEEDSQEEYSDQGEQDRFAQ